MRTRVDLQSVRNIAGGSDVVRQPGNEAANVRGYVGAVVFINVFEAVSGVTLSLDTSSDRNLGDGTPNFWYEMTSKSLGTQGVVTPFTISNLGDVVRWRVSSFASGNVSFSIVMYLSDQSL